MYRIDKSTCTFCAGCSAVCPELAITVYDDDIEISSACTYCGACALFCPVSAIHQIDGCDKTDSLNRKQLE